MDHRARLALAALLAAAITTPTLAQVTPPADKTAPKPAASPSPKKDAVAAVVNGEEVKVSDVVGVLGRYQIPAGSEKEGYDAALDMMINTRLLTQFLKQAKIPVTKADIDAQITREQEFLKQNKTDLASVLSESGTSLEKYRDRVAQNLQWKKFIELKATPAELQSFMEKNKDVFNGTLVRASHILVKIDPNASEADKTKAREKLQGIKKDIEAGKITFADAANKYSEDDGNIETPSGGDLGYFPRRGKFIDSFADAAFKMTKVGQISEPVETQYGFHLIQLTDRREGQKLDFKQFEDRVKEVYAAETQDTIVANARKTAKIDIKPMPADLFPKTAPAPDTTAPAPATTAAPKAAAPR